MKDGKMAGHKPQWPEAGDLVIATIESVANHGAATQMDHAKKQNYMFPKYQLHRQKTSETLSVKNNNYWIRATL
jgi:translation initiation factor 2 alpha subunit (eIF-2alpha)